MKLGHKPPPIWHEAKEVKNGFSRLNAQVSRLLLLENLWPKACGNKAKFWQLYAVKYGVIYVKTNIPAARQELLLQESRLVEFLNQNFDKPWIKSISVIQGEY